MRIDVSITYQNGLLHTRSEAANYIESRPALILLSRGSDSSELIEATEGRVREDLEDATLTVSKEQKRPRRGGSFTYGADFLRSAYRNGYIPDERRDSVGFRVARTIR